MSNSYYGYIYKITNKINSKFYIGQKKSSVFVESYWGSGNLITAAISKYGKDNFDREILQWCETRDELNAAEKYWISKYDATNKGYNLSAGGEGGNWSPKGIEGTRQGLIRYFSNPENRKKQSLKHKGLHLPTKGRTAANDERVRRRAEKQAEDYRTGKRVPANKGIPHKPETLKLMSECKLGEKNPFYGKHHSLESKQSMSEKLKGHVVTQECREKISKANSRENNGMYGKKPPNANKICITDGFKNKYVTEEELINFLENGWRRGSTQNHKK